ARLFHRLRQPAEGPLSVPLRPHVGRGAGGVGHQPGRGRRIEDPHAPPRVHLDGNAGAALRRVDRAGRHGRPAARAGFHRELRGALGVRASRRASLLRYRAARVRPQGGAQAARPGAGAQGRPGAAQRGVRVAHAAPADGAAEGRHRAGLRPSHGGRDPHGAGRDHPGQPGERAHQDRPAAAGRGAAGEGRRRAYAARGGERLRPRHGGRRAAGRARRGDGAGGKAADHPQERNPGVHRQRPGHRRRGRAGEPQAVAAEAEQRLDGRGARLRPAFAQGRADHRRAGVRKEPAGQVHRLGVAAAAAAPG
ncbi:MAG: FIG00513011: hypothetical protein, partial [uncultured Gemmatimonadetes bacterium]